MTLRHTPDHQWLRPEGGDAAIVGITAHAQDALGDVVFADLPAVGQRLAAGAVACAVESVKAAADVHAPVAGTVTAVNEALRASPELLNTDPLGAGWLFAMRMDNPADADALLDAAAYAALLAGG